MNCFHLVQKPGPWGNAIPKCQNPWVHQGKTSHPTLPIFIASCRVAYCPRIFMKSDQKNHPMMANHGKPLRASAAPAMVAGTSSQRLATRFEQLLQEEHFSSGGQGLKKLNAGRFCQCTAVARNVGRTRRSHVLDAEITHVYDFSKSTLIHNFAKDHFKTHTSCKSLDSSNHFDTSKLAARTNSHLPL